VKRLNTSLLKRLLIWESKWSSLLSCGLKKLGLELSCGCFSYFAKTGGLRRLSMELLTVFKTEPLMLIFQMAEVLDAAGLKESL